MDITEAYTLSITYQGTAIVGEKQLTSGKVTSIRVEVENPVFDSHSVEMVLRVLPLEVDYTAEVPIFHGARGAEMVVGVQVVGLETMIYSKHSFVTWKVQTDWDKVRQYYWIGRETRVLLKQSSYLAEQYQVVFISG